MKKALLFSVIAMSAATACLAQSTVTLEHGNPANGEFRVTYELEVPLAGPFLDFPSNGLLSPDAPLQVLSVTDQRSGKPLEFELRPMTDRKGKAVEGRYVVRTIRPKTQSRNQTTLVNYELVLFNQQDCHIAENGEWILQYETSRDTIFVLPEGHSTLDPNLPIDIDPVDGRRVLVQNRPADLPENQTRVLLFKTAEDKPPVKWWHRRIIRLYF